MNTRNLLIDRIKFLLILLVVIGHIGYVRTTFLDIRIAGNLTHSMNDLVRIIYLFHMPAFILISGYLTLHRPVKETFQKSLKFIKLFVIFHSFNLALSFLVSSQIPSFKDIIYPSFGLWYLLALFLWRVLFAFLDKWYNGTVFVIGSCIFSCLSVLLPIPSFLGLNRFLSFLPFFALGYVLRREGLLLDEHRSMSSFLNKWGGRLCLLLSICILAFIEIPPFYGIERGISFSTVLMRMEHIGLALLLCGAVFPLLKLLPQNEQLFVYGGKQSLFIYLYHPYLLLLLSYISSVMFNEITVLIGVFLALLTTAILLFLSRVKFFQILIS